MSVGVTGILLAGGAGRRLGGVDKGLQLYVGRPLAETMLSTLHEVCSTIMISANRNLDIYQGYGPRVVADAERDFGGPLAGLAACLPLVTDEYALIVPCDMPHLPAFVLQQLIQSVSSGANEGVVAADVSRCHYSVAAVRVAPALRALRHVWLDGQRSLRAWQQQMSVAVHVFDDATLFVNCNTPASLA